MRHLEYMGKLVEDLDYRCILDYSYLVKLGNGNHIIPRDAIDELISTHENFLIFCASRWMIGHLGVEI